MGASATKRFFQRLSTGLHVCISLTLEVFLSHIYLHHTPHHITHLHHTTPHHTAQHITATHLQSVHLETGALRVLFPLGWATVSIKTVYKEGRNGRVQTIRTSSAHAHHALLRISACNSMPCGRTNRHSSLLNLILVS